MEKRTPTGYTNFYLTDGDGNNLIKVGAIWHFESANDKAISARMTKDPEYLNKMIAAGKVSAVYNSSTSTKKTVLPDPE